MSVMFNCMKLHEVYRITVDVRCCTVFVFDCCIDVVAATAIIAKTMAVCVMMKETVYECCQL